MPDFDLASAFVQHRERKREFPKERRERNSVENGWRN